MTDGRWRQSHLSAVGRTVAAQAGRHRENSRFGVFSRGPFGMTRALEHDVTEITGIRGLGCGHRGKEHWQKPTPDQAYRRRRFHLFTSFPTPARIVPVGPSQDTFHLSVFRQNVIWFAEIDTGHHAGCWQQPA